MIKGFIYFVTAFGFAAGVSTIFYSNTGSQSTNMNSDNEPEIELLIKNSKDNWSETVYIKGLETSNSTKVTDALNEEQELKVESDLQIDDIPLTRNF